MLKEVTVFNHLCGQVEHLKNGVNVSEVLDREGLRGLDFYYVSTLEHLHVPFALDNLVASANNPIEEADKAIRDQFNHLANTTDGRFGWKQMGEVLVLHDEETGPFFAIVGQSPTYGYRLGACVARRSSREPNMIRYGYMDCNSPQGVAKLLLLGLFYDEANLNKATSDSAQPQHVWWDTFAPSLFGTRE